MKLFKKKHQLSTLNDLSWSHERSDPPSRPYPPFDYGPPPPRKGVTESISHAISNGFSKIMKAIYTIIIIIVVLSVGQMLVTAYFIIHILDKIITWLMG